MISGIQQMGIGIPNVHEAWTWYRKTLGMDVPIFEEAATADLMLPYTGGKPHDRHAILALNMQGGGGFEIWQYTSRTPQPANFDIELGDLGIYACKIKSQDVDKCFQFMKDKGVTVSKEVTTLPNGNKHFLIQDPYGNIFEIVSSRATFKNTRAYTGGVAGAIIGVSDIDKSLSLFKDVLGYDVIEYDITDEASDISEITKSGEKYRRVLLSHSNKRLGAFSELLGPSEIELIQRTTSAGRKIYKDRFWGDLGFIHLCYDVTDMKSLKKKCEEHGYPFTVDSANSFDMGEAAGHFTYIADLDGTLIEFVETHKIPILKKIGWYLNLQKRDPNKSLPRWMINALGMNRKKD